MEENLARPRKSELPWNLKPSFSIFMALGCLFPGTFSCLLFDRYIEALLLFGLFGSFAFVVYLKQLRLLEERRAEFKAVLELFSPKSKKGKRQLLWVIMYAVLTATLLLGVFRNFIRQQEQILGPIVGPLIWGFGFGLFLSQYLWARKLPN